MWPKAVAAQIGVAVGVTAALVLLLHRRRARAAAEQLSRLERKLAAEDGPPPTTIPPNGDAGISPAAADGEDGTPRERAKAHLRFGNTCARGGFPDKALKHYVKALELHPDYAAAHHNCASVLQRLTRFDEAIVHYEKALAIKPSHLEAASNLGVAQLNAKRFADAAETCKRAIAMQAEAGDGMNLEASHHRNVALRLLGQREAAVEETWGAIEALVRGSSAANVRPPPVAIPLRSDSPTSLKARRASLTPPPLTIACVKWGNKYGADYVNRLHRSVRRALGNEGVASFICFTERGDGLDPQIEVRPLPAKPEWQGWWFKAHLFSPEAKLSGRVLYLDLDTVIVGSLERLRRYRGRFATLSTRGFDAEEGFVDGYNTSAMMWDADAEEEAAEGGDGGTLQALYTALRREVFSCLMRWDHWVEMVVPRADLLQDAFPDVFVDYRTHCRDRGSPPNGAAVVCFPRYPKPHEAKDVPWIERHWR